MKKSSINKNTTVMNVTEFKRFLKSKNVYHFDYWGITGTMEYKSANIKELLRSHWLYKIIFVSKRNKLLGEQRTRSHWKSLHWVAAYNKKNYLYYVTRYKGY